VCHILAQIRASDSAGVDKLVSSLGTGDALKSNIDAQLSKYRLSKSTSVSPVDFSSGSSTSAEVEQCLGIVINRSCIATTAIIGSAVVFVVVGIAAYCCVKRFWPSEAGNPQLVTMSGAAVTCNLGTAAAVSATGSEAGNMVVWVASKTVTPGIAAVPVVPSAPPLEDLVVIAASEEGFPQQARGGGGGGGGGVL
jgi:hypothetical protein